MKRFKTLSILIVSVLFFVLSFFFFHDIRPTMLLQTFSIAPQPTVFWDEILPKKPFIFTFVADQDNMGTVEVRFRSYKRQDNYALLFQLREQGSSTMLYENIYYLFPFEQERLFPFGFPVIPQSRGKNYEITLSSIGNKDIPVIVSHVNPSVAAKYYVPLTQLKTQGAHAILTFVNKKLVNTFTNWQFILNAMCFFCPMAFLLYRFLFKIEVKEAIFLTFITNVILFSALGYISVYFGYLLFYIIVCFLIAKYTFDWPYEIPLWSVFVCMIGSMAALLIGKLMIAEQFAIWILPTSACYLLYAVVNKDTSMKNMHINTKIIAPIVLIVMVVGLLYSACKNISAVLYIKPSDAPIISYMGPTIVYNATDVLIKGSGFGSQYTGEVRIMSTYGEIEESTWTNDAIVFRIPLEWNVGTFSVWMERKIDTAWIKIPAGQYSLNLLDKSKPWTVEDDQYYKQIINGPKELLKANEYSMGWYY